MSVRPFILSAVAAAAGAASAPGVAAAAAARFGLNTPSVNYFEPTRIYADVIKSAPNWWGFNDGSGPWWPVQVVAVDANGDPTESFYVFAMENNAKFGGSAGQYTGWFKGQATVQSALTTPAVTDVVYDAGADETTFKLEPGANQIHLKFSGLSPTFGGLKLMRPGHSLSDKYSQWFTSMYSRAKHIRFMDFMLVNGDVTVNWAAPARSRMGVGMFEAVEMMNDLGKDGWFCLPILASDAYVSSMATYLRDNASPGLGLTIELGNENWNPAFGQYHWSWYKGLAKAKVLQNQQTIDTSLNYASRKQGVAASDVTTSPAAAFVRRSGGEVFIRHSGVIPFASGQRFIVQSQGHASVSSLIPGVGTPVVITRVSDVEFKFANAGADASEVALSAEGQPTFKSAPIISVQKTSGVVRVVHDGHLPLAGSIRIDGFGAYEGLSGKTGSTLMAITPTIIDANTFDVTLPTAGADIALSTSFTSSNAVVVYTDITVPIVQGVQAGTNVYEFQRRWYVERLKFVSDTFRTVFGAEFGSRVRITLAGQTSEFGVSAPLRTACAWVESQLGAAPGDYLHDVCVAPYITWDWGDDYVTARSDPTGAAGAQILVDKAATQYAVEAQATAAFAKRHGLTWSFYEAGVDTANPTDTSPTTGVPVAIREAVQHNGLMRSAIRNLIDFGARYGFDKHCQYSGSIQTLLDGTGSSIYVSWHLAETTDSVAPIGAITSASAQKLAGVDDYLASQLVSPVGNVSPGVGTIAGSAFQFFERYDFGPAWTPPVYASYFTNYGGTTIQSYGSSEAGYGCPSVQYLVFAAEAGTYSLYLNAKTDDRGVTLADYETRIDVDVNGGPQAQILNPSPVSSAVLTSGGGLVESGPYPVTLAKGANLLALKIRMPQVQQHFLVLGSLRLT